MKNEPHKLVLQLIVMLLHFQRKLILFQKSYKGTREGNIFKGRNWETTGAVDARSCLNLLLLLWNDLSHNFLRSSAYFCGNSVWFIQDWHWSPVSYSGSPVLHGCQNLQSQIISCSHNLCADKKHSHTEIEDKMSSCWKGFQSTKFTLSLYASVIKCVGRLHNHMLIGMT